MRMMFRLAVWRLSAARENRWAVPSIVSTAMLRHVT